MVIEDTKTLINLSLVIQSKHNLIRCSHS